MSKLRPSALQTSDGRRVMADRLVTKFVKNDDGSGVYTVDNGDPISLEDALELAGFDATRWEVKEVTTGGHVVPMKLERKVNDKKIQTPVAVYCSKWTVRVKPLHPGVSAMHELLADMRKSSPKVPKMKRPRKTGRVRRALEIDIMDAHVGIVRILV